MFRFWHVFFEVSTGNGLFFGRVLKRADVFLLPRVPEAWRMGRVLGI